MPEDRTWVEKLEVAGQDLVQHVRDSATRRVTIFAEDGTELLSMPLTVGVVAGALVTLSVPALAGLGALAALVSRMRLDVTRHAPRDSDTLGPPQRRS